MNDLLFNVPQNKTRLQIAKETHGIETENHHLQPGEKSWIAIHRQSCVDRFSGYGVTDEMSIGEMFASVCRLMEEMGMIGYGETESEAVLDLCRNLNIQIVL